MVSKDNIMVGDWLHCTKDNTNRKVLNFGVVRNCHTNFDVIEDVWYAELDCGKVNGQQLFIMYRLKDLDPVPLTEKILEKNFSANKQITWVKGWNSKNDLYVEIKTNSGCVSRVCDYVHELQHAIKLTGIKKTIKL